MANELRDTATKVRKVYSKRLTEINKGIQGIDSSLDLQEGGNPVFSGSDRTQLENQKSELETEKSEVTTDISDLNTIIQNLTND